ncbi:MAG: hypothetical protein DRP65_07200 [Planctomycetota bacterium]|nr:MAG: hypothetical protein DRP65_07200 [Planctomycetota bacterium]
MKIYWKALLWNYTTRLWLCWKFRHNSCWKNYFTAKRVWNSKQAAKIKERMRSLVLGPQATPTFTSLKIGTPKK